MTRASFLLPSLLTPTLFFWQKQNLLLCPNADSCTGQPANARAWARARVCRYFLLCSLDVWILNTCNTVEIIATHLVCSPLLLGFHFSQEAAAHHLHPRVPPATLRTAPAIWALPGLVYGVRRPRLLWAVWAAAVVCGLWAAGSISAAKNWVIFKLRLNLTTLFHIQIQQHFTCTLSQGLGF